MLAEMKFAVVSLRRQALLAAFTALAATACDKSGNSPDAATNDGKPRPAAQMIDCPNSVAAVITEVTLPNPPGGFAYSPNPAMIAKGKIVKFSLGPSHTAVSRKQYFDFREGERGCVIFNDPGTYDFFCIAHGFVGAIVVQ
mgnify:CR=1 FL=1|jgi:plastocyanin